MRDRNFVINSIKMDLHRVVTASGDLSKPLPVVSIVEFLNHAIADFNKLELTVLEKKLKDKLLELSTKTNTLIDSKKRLRWTEEVLTTRCRLG